MIEGLFEANSLVMLAGPPASFKSFLALDWMLSMASGRKWLNRPTTHAKVLYVLGEGKASLLKRIEAWASFYAISHEEQSSLVDHFRVSFEVPQMAMKASVDNMLFSLTQEDFTPNVIVVDTFARSFVGLDENSQRDTGMWVESADRLRNLGYTVIFLHHTTKNTEFGLKYRGSTAIMGAMDTAFTLSRDGGPTRVKLECSKQKDHDEGAPLHFQRLIVRGRRGEEGSLVLTPAAALDERFTEEGRRIETTIRTLLDDPTYASDRARARELAAMFPEQLTDGAAQTRISKLRKSESTLDSNSPQTHSQTH